MKCPICNSDKPFGEGGYLGTNLANESGLPKWFDVIDCCICCDTASILLKDGSIYTWPFIQSKDRWTLFRKLIKNPKFIGGFKVIQ
jgi:hypothetical protein